MGTNSKIKETRATQAEVENRVAVVVEMILQGYPRHKILSYGLKEWKIRAKGTDTYISKAKKIIKEIANQDSEMEFEKAKARLNDLYSKAFKNKDYRECRNIQAELNKLTGVYAPVKQQHTGDIGFYQLLTNDTGDGK